VCYDLRFADLFWDAAPRTDLYLGVANWPASRAGHWITLLRARAIENQAYVVGVNRVGEGGGLAYAGGSHVIGPQGEILAEAGEDEVTVFADIDPSRVAETRRDFPFQQDRGENKTPED
jgi:predicted amidohydrolase